MLKSFKGVISRVNVMKIPNLTSIVSKKKILRRFNNVE